MRARRWLVKIGDQMVWQTIAKGEDGKPVVTDMRAASEQEVAAYQQELASQQAKQAKQTCVQDDAVFQRKIGEIASGLGIFGSTGQLVAGLAGGPNPYSGKPGAGWISGWILAQRLNGRAEGKLLPTWISSGPVATAIEWGLQAYGMLDMGKDVRTLREYFGNVPKLPPVNPNAVQQLTAAGAHPAMAARSTSSGPSCATAPSRSCRAAPTPRSSTPSSVRSSSFRRPTCTRRSRRPIRSRMPG